MKKPLYFLVVLLSTLTMVLATPLEENQFDEPGMGPQPTLANVSYGTHPKQVLHFWKAQSDKPAPLLFEIHGGGWIGGGRMSGLGELLEPMLEAGISVVSIEYRFIGEAIELGIEPPVKAPMHDAARALQFVRSKAEDWGIDAERIIVSGSSAGACTSLWLAFHDDLSEPRSSDPVARESTRLMAAAVTNAQTTLDPEQMCQWIPNSVYGSHAFGIFKSVNGGPLYPEGKFAMDMDAFLEQRDEMMPWINEYSPYSHASADDPPIYLNYNKEAPNPYKPHSDPTHSSNFGFFLLQHLNDMKVDCELVYPGAPNAEYETVAEYIISKFNE